jgi:hypothetical protein
VTYKKQLQNIRRLIVFFMIMLALSGITAFPLETELRYLTTHFIFTPLLNGWLQQVYHAIASTNAAYPFLQYGYDWLAFAHIMIALFFIGPYKDPVRNIWVIEWAMIACICVLPLALICGPIRGIPFYWQLIDCSFGILGIIPLYICRRWIKKLALTSAAS